MRWITMVVFMMSSQASMAMWLCEAKSRAGFERDDAANWAAKEIDVEGSRYEIRPAEEYDIEDATWMVIDARTRGIVAITNDRLTEEGYPVFFKDRLAKGRAVDFRFNLSALKYQLVNFEGFYVERYDSRIRPYMEIGHCKRLES